MLNRFVQLAEDAQLGELGDAGQEDKLEMGVEHLERTVEILHRAAQQAEVFLLVHHVEQGRVVLVDDDDHLLARLLVRPHHQVLQAYVGVLLLALVPEHLLLVVEHVGEITPEHGVVHVLCAAHVEVEHGMPHPLLLVFAHGKPLEQVLAPLVVRMDHRGKQRLAEPSRTVQEHILIAIADKVDKILCLVDIKIITLPYLLKRLYSYGVFPYCCHSILVFLSCLSSRARKSHPPCKFSDYWCHRQVLFPISNGRFCPSVCYIRRPLTPVGL